MLAVSLLKEIQNKVPYLSPQEVSLLEAGSSYYLRFKGLCNECKKQVLEIANEHNLLTKEQGNSLTISDINT